MPETVAVKQVVVGIIIRNNQLLICQRRADQPFALQWEFPGGKVEIGEDLSTALVRELREELGNRPASVRGRARCGVAFLSHNALYR